MCIPLLMQATGDEYSKRLQPAMAAQLASPLMSPEELEKRQAEAALLQLNTLLTRRNRSRFDAIAGQSTDPGGRRPPERDWRTNADAITGETPRMTRQPTTKAGPHILSGIRALIGPDPF